MEPVADVFRAAGCEIVSIEEMTREINPWRDLVALVKLTRVCRQGRFEVVHPHTSRGCFIGRAAARLAGVPVVFGLNALSFAVVGFAALALGVKQVETKLLEGQPHREIVSLADA